MNIRLFEQILFEASKDRFLRPLFDKYADKNYGENDYDSILKWIDSGAADKHKFDWQSKDKEKLFNNIYNSYSDYMKSGGSRKNQKKDPINIFKNSGLKFDTIETADEDTELLFQGETERWLYISPLSWEAAKWMDSLNCGGQGAQWCIGYEKTDDYWKEYTNNESKFVLTFDKENYAKQFENKIKYMLEIRPNKYIKVWNQIDDSIRYKECYKDLNIEDACDNFDNAFYKKPIIFNGFVIKNGHCDIPEGITEIEEYAFDECKSLKSITIPNSVTKIGDSAFTYCESLQSITIPNSVTEIRKFAFDGCKSLKSIAIPNSVTKIGNNAFASCESLQSITIPNSVTEIGNNAFYNCCALQSINIPNSVTKIEKYAFAYCESLQSITIPNSVTEIGNNAFYNCCALQSINIPNSVTKIEKYAFYNCCALQSIDIPDYVTKIEEFTFAYCESLQSITIPDSVTEIGKYTFYNCCALQSINIPNSVTKIENNAFYGCPNVEIEYRD